VRSRISDSQMESHSLIGGDFLVNHKGRLEHKDGYFPGDPFGDGLRGRGFPFSPKGFPC